MLLVWTAALLLSATQETADYNMTATLSPANPTGGTVVTYELTIAAKGTWGVKSETPFKAELAAPAKLGLAKVTFANADVTYKEKSLSITTTFAAAKAHGSIDASVTFFLCTEKICQRFKDKMAVPLHIP